MFFFGFVLLVYYLSLDAVHATKEQVSFHEPSEHEHEEICKKASTRDFAFWKDVFDFLCNEKHVGSPHTRKAIVFSR